MSDPQVRVSTAHLQLEHSAAGWFAQDISRVMLPRAGELCLGRPFADDPRREFTVSFDAADP